MACVDLFRTTHPFANKWILSVLVCIFLQSTLVLSKPYSKYGRTCQDIGCTNNEVCVIQEDPCSFASRDRECGRYPTCKPSYGGQRSCDSVACGLNEECQIVNNEAKCVSTSSRNRPTENSNRPSYPSTTSGLYPGGTTSRPSPFGSNYPSPGGGNGFTGGQPGSGFPGRNSPYPQQNYPQPNGNNNFQQSYARPNYADGPQQPSNGADYPRQPNQNQGGSLYPTLGRPENYYPPNNAYPPPGGYPGYNGGYPTNNNGYPQQNYPGYNPYNNNNRYNQPPSGSNKENSLFSVDNLLKAGKAAFDLYKIANSNTQRTN